jgi:hypothetical protein
LNFSKVAIGSGMWQHRAMPKDRDFFVNARRVVEQAIGEHIDGSPLEKRTPRAAAGSVGGKKAGKLELLNYPLKNEKR